MSPPPEKMGGQTPRLLASVTYGRTLSPLGHLSCVAHNYVDFIVTVTNLTSFVIASLSLLLFFLFEGKMRHCSFQLVCQPRVSPNPNTRVSEYYLKPETRVFFGAKPGFHSLQSNNITTPN